MKNAYAVSNISYSFLLVEGIVMIPPSTPFWIAVGIGLCKFFGGKIEYSNVKLKFDKTYRKPRAKNNPTDGKPWCDFQKDMMSIKPLTMKDLKTANKVAAYNFNYKEARTKTTVKA